MDVVAHSGLLWTMRRIPVRSQRRGRDAGGGQAKKKTRGRVFTTVNETETPGGDLL